MRPGWPPGLNEVVPLVLVAHAAAAAGKLDGGKRFGPWRVGPWRVGLLGLDVVLSVAMAAGTVGGAGVGPPYVRMAWPGMETTEDLPERALELARGLGLVVVAREARVRMAAASASGLDVVRLAEESLARDVMGA